MLLPVVAQHIKHATNLIALKMTLDATYQVNVLNKMWYFRVIQKIRHGSKNLNDI